MGQTEVASQFFKGILPVLYSTAVAPYYGRAKRLHITANRNKPVHLIRDTDSTNAVLPGPELVDALMNRRPEVQPPVLRVLFSPARINGNNLHLILWIKG